MLLQSEEVLSRPWCLLELYAAATAGIPIVALACSGKGYDFAAAEDHLLHLDTSLPASNPSAVGVLEANNAPVLRVAQVLWACLPSIICVPLNSSGSENAMRAAVADLVKAMQRAQAIPVPSDEDAWLEDREARDGLALSQMIEKSSTLRGTQRGRMLQRVERAAELERDVAELKAALKERGGVAKGQVLAKAARADALAEEVAELKRAMAEKEAERKAEVAALVDKSEARIDKLEIELVAAAAKYDEAQAEHKAELAIARGE